MKRSFFSNISLLIFLNIIVKAFWVLGIDRTVQNRVGAGDYGLYFSLFSFSVLFNILLDFGITNYNNRKVAANPELMPGMLGNLFAIRLIFAFFYLAVSLATAVAMGYSPGQRSLLYLLLANQFLASFILYLRSNITALHLFRTDSLLSVVDRLIMIIVCGMLLWGGVTAQAFRIEWFIYSQSIAYFTTFISALVIVLKKSGLARITIKPGQMPAILKESAPFALLSLFMAVYWRVDTVMLERMLPNGEEAAGIYAQAFRLLDAASMIPYLFAVILLPMFSGALARRESCGTLARYAAILLVIPATLVTVISATYPAEIMELLYHQHIEASAYLFRILMVAFVPVSVIYVYSTLLTASGNLKVMNRIAGSGMVVNILLNLVLIPGMGAAGSASASVATQVVMSVLFFFYGVKIVERGGQVMFIVRIIINIAVISGVAALLKFFHVNSLAAVLIIIITGLLFPLLIGITSITKIRQFIFGNIE